MFNSCRMAASASPSLLNATLSRLDCTLHARSILFRKLSVGFRVIFKPLLKDRPAGGKPFGPLLILRRLLLALLRGGECRSGRHGGVHRTGGRCGRNSFRRGSAIGGRLDR